MSDTSKQRLDAAYRAFFECHGDGRWRVAAALDAVDVYDRAHAPKMRVTDEMVRAAMKAWDDTPVVFESPAEDAATTMRCILEAALSCAPGAVSEPAAAPDPIPATGYHAVAEAMYLAKRQTELLRQVVEERRPEKAAAAPKPDPNEECVIWDKSHNAWWVDWPVMTDRIDSVGRWPRAKAEAIVRDFYSVRDFYRPDRLEIRPAPSPNLSALLADVARTAHQVAGTCSRYPADAWLALSAWAKASGERT